MKVFLLTAAALMAYAGSLFAQNLPPDYNWEIGVNGGYSVITRPLGPADAYQGTRTNVVKDYSIHINYVITPNWLLTLDAGDRRWETFGDWKQNTTFGGQLVPQQVSFLLASHAFNQSIGMNYVIPFYTRYQTFNRSNIYFGVNAGLIETVNDGSTGYSYYKSAPDSGGRYISSYNYGFGMGYSFGLQMGYTYYIIPRLGINIELGMRYANVTTNDMNYREENSKYHLLHFPETFGIRWRF